MHQPLIELTRLLQQFAEVDFHRRLLVLSGKRDWCRQTASELVTTLPLTDTYWVGESAPDGITHVNNRHAQGLLGTETGLLVYDAFSGFDADAFGALTGTLRGGGILFLLTPPLSTWATYPDPEHARIAVAGIPATEVSGRFLGRLAEMIESDPSVTCIQQGAVLPGPLKSHTATHSPRADDPACRTQDQQQAVDAVMHVVTGHRRRPVVLISDRGRGKSSALGIAAARLLKSGRQTILVTAPRQQSTRSLFAQAAKLLPEAQTHKGSIHLGQARISYSAPDHLLQHPQIADLLLVDEAAAIPTPELEGLLDHYPRIAFATTVHGYEGTGRGFALRFRSILDKRFPQWRELRLETPIRWAPDDPLEAWLFRALALDASPVPNALIQDIQPDECTFANLKRDKLAACEQDLRDLFGLLVLAHYRTTPFDLRHLLDGPNLSVTVLKYRERIIATALVAEEGGFDPQTAHAIWAGYRRPRGHLLAQSLAAHVGLESAACLRGARIMRIAVHPALQKRGLGSRLVMEIRHQALATGLDYLGTSFGATPDLLSFWGKNQLYPLRIGLSRGASSGAQSVMMLHPLTAAGDKVYQIARLRFNKQLPWLLADPLKNLDPSLACALLAQSGSAQPLSLDAYDWHDLIGFAFARRGYEMTLPSIKALTLAALTELPLDADTAKLLLMKVLQNQAWRSCAIRFDLPGRSSVEERLRRAMGELILHYADEPTRSKALQIQCFRFD